MISLIALDKYFEYFLAHGVNNVLTILRLKAANCVKLKINEHKSSQQEIPLYVCVICKSDSSRIMKVCIRY